MSTTQEAIESEAQRIDDLYLKYNGSNNFVERQEALDALRTSLTHIAEVAKREEYERGWADGVAGTMETTKLMDRETAEQYLRQKGYNSLADALASLPASNEKV